MNQCINSRSDTGNVLLSVVLPVYNERESLEQLAAGLSASLRRCGCRSEILFVNDGSRDGKRCHSDDLARGDPGIRVLHPTRNFGQQGRCTPDWSTPRRRGRHGCGSPGRSSLHPKFSGEVA